MYERVENATGFSRLEEESLCEVVPLEFVGGMEQPCSWNKAIAESKGEDHNVIPILFKLRLQSLHDEEWVTLALFESELNAPFIPPPPKKASRLLAKMSYEEMDKLFCPVEGPSFIGNGLLAIFVLFVFSGVIFY